jgi:hypothetical protein
MAEIGAKAAGDDANADMACRSQDGDQRSRSHCFLPLSQHRGLRPPFEAL